MGPIVRRKGSVRPLFFGLATAAFTLLPILPAGAQRQIGVTINGDGVEIIPEPITRAGRVFVPLRGVFEDLGATVVYADGQINATGNGNDISLWLGSPHATVNGSPATIDVPPFMIGGSAYVPLRFVSQALGADVTWDEAEQTVAITTNGGILVTSPPPPIPAYAPPPVPEPNDLWVPGYWAWSTAGYYWVPGTWVPAPQPGFLWTPGYWSGRGRHFHWHSGYWGPRIGYYGGINYGGGYFGRGFVGGKWSRNAFRYNTAVTPVTDQSLIRNVYRDKTVINAATVPNHSAVNPSYNGDSGGIEARPTADELEASRGPRRAMTAPQRRHAEAASQDRRFLESVNSGEPPVPAVPHPYTLIRRPRGFVPLAPEDRAGAGQLEIAPTPESHPVTPHEPAPLHRRIDNTPPMPSPE